MTDKAIVEILNRWDIVVDKLTAISPEIYKFYLRQAILIDGVIKGIISLAILVSVWIAVFKLVNMFKHRENDIDDPLYILGFMLAAVGILITTLTLSDAVSHLVNPGYYVVRSIVETFIK